MDINNNTPVYSISVASTLTETPVRMLREYEKQGLIRPKKLNNRRLFTNCEIGFIKDMRHYLTEERMTINGLKEFYFRASCWEIKQCKQKKCPAFGNMAKHCWEVVKHHKLCDGEACPSCPIFIVKTSAKNGKGYQYESHFAYEIHDKNKD